MSFEIWAAVGPLVGVIVGGALSFRTEKYRTRSAHRAWSLEQRRQCYQAYIGGCQDQLDSLADDELPDNYLKKLNARLLGVLIFGSKTARAQAEGVKAALKEQANGNSDASTGDDVESALADFIGTARKELGLDD